ncbi:hypothetical protein [Escherichia coli]|uniref:hypothetical protein n=1 Tax=Escherichia coli TaxID=562 RepID=UPI001FF4BF47|nr:hypothetical protein [Escherichia coli]
MRICIFGYKTCPSVHRIMHHATNLRDETGADVLFIDAEKHGISLKVMSERAGCAVEKFPCVFVDDVYLEPLPPVPGQPHYTYC